MIHIIEILVSKFTILGYSFFFFGYLLYAMSLSYALIWALKNIPELNKWFFEKAEKGNAPKESISYVQEMVKTKVGNEKLYDIIDICVKESFLNYKTYLVPLILYLMFIFVGELI